MSGLCFLDHLTITVRAAAEVGGPRDRPEPSCPELTGGVGGEGDQKNSKA